LDHIGERLISTRILAFAKSKGGNEGAVIQRVARRRHHIARPNPKGAKGEKCKRQKWTPASVALQSAFSETSKGARPKGSPARWRTSKNAGLVQRTQRPPRKREDKEIRESVLEGEQAEPNSKSCFESAQNRADGRRRVAAKRWGGRVAVRC